ncbi:hypothetical protein LMG19282_01471 [Cupriavidus campinensis]|uniref:Type 4 secretion system PilS N-terminal domain-containing protein n=1 Tax=Cupriavidus campinensis TaxID=151783 RepID=A0ABY3EJ94_9BURK|nr:type 4 pilus major pilin [Cupriavidus campinensis]TSP11001.1 hypothetical protein FGG12_19245 [Cupriavidus campinensis]CAG2138268.1 hypothetical protein LMG19282_01471 [Cupriavidus campinensis]
MKSTARTHRQIPRLNKKQRGNLLLQVIVVIAIMAIIGLAATRGMAWLNNMRAQNLGSEWSQHAVKAVQYAGTHGGTFADIDTETCAGYFFDKKQYSGSGASTTIRATEGRGVVTCTPAQTVTANDSIAMTYTGYTEAVCTNAVMDGTANVIAVSVGSTLIKSTNQEPNDKAIMQACRAGGENNTITVTFTR